MAFPVTIHRDVEEYSVVKETHIHGDVQRFFQRPAIVGIVQVQREVGGHALERSNAAAGGPESLVSIGSNTVRAAGAIAAIDLAKAPDGLQRFEKLFFRKDPSGRNGAKITKLITGPEI